MLESLIPKLKNLIAQPNKNAIFILGNQKTGSTIIAHLLGEATGLSVQDDLQDLAEPNQSKIFRNNLRPKKALSGSKLLLTKDIIKENCITFNYDKFRQDFIPKKNVFIIRNPFENIRSILNRLDIPGNMDSIKLSNYNVNATWASVIDNSWQDIHSENYIESMAERWKKSADIYIKYQNEFELIKYEDFRQDKINSIIDLAKRLNLKITKDISKSINKQYGSKGNHKLIGLDFFGEKNYNRIEKICNEPYHLIYNRKLKDLP